MTTEATAATAEALTESPRDLPNAPADRQALSLVKPYLGMVAWPTVFVAARHIRRLHPSSPRRPCGSSRSGLA